MENGGEKQIQSIAKAIRLMETMAIHKTPMSLGELAQQLGWAKSTTHGILATLVANSVVEQSQTDGRYMLGIRLFELGCAVSSSWDITAVAKSHLQHLALVTEESAFLTAIDGLDSVLLDSAEVAGNFKIIPEHGARTPLYCNSQGKVLLAYQPASSFNKILRMIDFNMFTPHTVNNPEMLSASCQKIREDGYCVEKGEYRMGLCSVSAPVFNFDGKVKYAIGIVGMFSNVHSPAFVKVIDAVRGVAKSVSYEMGYREKNN
jgi:DNA-binding IclR family transcriptional regulator